MAPKREVSVNVGIDVGKHQLDVYIRERDLHFNVPNDPDGIHRLVGRLGRYRLERIVVEATGRREYEVVLALAERRFGEGSGASVSNVQVDGDRAQASLVVPRNYRWETHQVTLRNRGGAWRVASFA